MRDPDGSNVPKASEGLQAESSLPAPVAGDVEETSLEAPVETGTDVRLIFGRRAVEAVPFAGPTLGEAFGRTLGGALERRRDRWRQDVTDRLNELDAQDRVDLEVLVDDEAFATVLLNATEAAMRTHHEEKLDALRNAVSNAACDSGVDSVLQETFVQFIEEFTPWHLRVLDFFSRPAEHFEPGDPLRHRPLRSAEEAIVGAIEELANRRGIVAKLHQDLRDRGLVDHHDLEVSRGNPALRSRTTELGDQFLEFIRKPDLSPTDLEQAPGDAQNTQQSGGAADEN